MLNPDQARAFARDWIDAWNAHDLERILSHYEDDFEMHSPVIVTTMGEPSGTLRGKAAVGEYWQMALQRYHDLQFELVNVLQGAGSITILYNGVRGLSAEVFHFAPSGKVHTAYAHYLP